MQQINNFACLNAYMLIWINHKETIDDLLNFMPN